MSWSPSGKDSLAISVHLESNQNFAWYRPLWTPRSIKPLGTAVYASAAPVYLKKLFVRKKKHSSFYYFISRGSREMDGRCAHAFPVTHWTTYARWLQTWIITDTQCFFSFFEDDHQYFRYMGHVTRRVANQIELVVFHLLSVMVNELWRRQHYGFYTGQRSTMAAHRCTKCVHVTRAPCINM